MTKRIVAYIDWFNLYHSLANNLPEKYKWMNYTKLVNEFLEPGDVLNNIFLFTASPHWNEISRNHHADFINVMHHYWIVIVWWKYKSVQKKFNSLKMPVCKVEWTVINPTTIPVTPSNFIYQTYEEKQTDVNMALAIFEWALMNFYDKALIFSGDSDIAPAITRSKKYCKSKEFHCILPFLGRWRSIAGVCNKTNTISQRELDKCFLDDTIITPNGTVINPYK